MKNAIFGLKKRQDFWTKIILFFSCFSGHHSALSKDGGKTKSSPVVVDSEFDYSILWDDEDEDNGFLTYSLDKLPDDIGKKHALKNMTSLL